MRQAEKGRKKFQSRLPFTLDPGMKIPKKIAKKIKKTPFQQYFQPKWNEIGGEREKKNLDPNFFHTRPGQENFGKKSKKIQNYEKPLSGIIFN